MFRAEEDYIKLIYTLTIENSLELVKTTTLAKRLNHSNQTIIEMVKVRTKGVCRILSL